MELILEILYKYVDGVKVEYDAADYAQYEADRKYEVEVWLPLSARQRRDALLAECDWTQAKDIPDSVSSAWATYRQALRDVPQQPGFPLNVAWPQKP